MQEKGIRAHKLKRVLAEFNFWPFPTHTSPFPPFRLSFSKPICTHLVIFCTSIYFSWNVSLMNVGDKWSAGFRMQRFTIDCCPDPCSCYKTWDYDPTRWSKIRVKYLLLLIDNFYMRHITTFSFSGPSADFNKLL